MMRRILGRILGALAVGAPAAQGCAARVVTEDEGGGSPDDDASSTGVTMEPTSDPAPSPITSASTGTGFPDGDGDVAGDDVKFDHPPMDISAPIDPVDCVDPVGNPDFACDAPGTLHYFCVLPAPGTSCEDGSEWEAAALANACIGVDCFGPGYASSGCGYDPSVADACCYWLAHIEDQQWCPGRPFVVDGTARLAAITPRDDWTIPAAPDVRPLSAIERDGLAAMWGEHARFEHASVASFARFVLHLLALGAPADLVAGAQYALSEELRHATSMFGLASAYAGRAIGPGPLHVADGLSAHATMESIVRAAVEEGCIAETISALHVAEAARRATDPAVIAVLESIADDELRHAELAWRFVRWAVDRGDAALRRTVTAAFADAARRVPRGPAIPPSLSPAIMLAHGLLPESLREALAHAALRDIVAPAATALLSIRRGPPARAASLRS